MVPNGKIRTQQMMKLVVALAVVSCLSGAFNRTAVAAPKEAIFADATQILPQLIERSIANTLADFAGVPAQDLQVQLKISRVRHAWSEENHSQNAIRKVDFHNRSQLLSAVYSGILSVPFSFHTDTETIDGFVEGSIRVLGPVWVAQSHLKRGELIQSQHLAREIQNWRSVPQKSLTMSESSIVGQVLRQSVSKGTPIQQEFLAEAPMVRQGEQVELVVITAPGVQIRSKAEAQQDGVEGAMISVRQPQTQKIIRAKVVREKSVEVRL